MLPVTGLSVTVAQTIFSAVPAKMFWKVVFLEISWTEAPAKIRLCTSIQMTPLTSTLKRIPLTVDTRGREIRGTALGVHEDGALLVDTGAGEPFRVTSGTVVAADGRDEPT